MLKWPWFEFFKTEQTHVFELPPPAPAKTSRPIKGYLDIGELISPPEPGPEPLFFPKAP